MEMKPFADTGVQVPEIGLGLWQFRGGVEPIRRAIDLGAVLIDTAEVYGTEDVAGEAIKGKRDRVFLATKVSGSHLRYKEVLAAADDSLRRLGTDTIDLYQIHWPTGSVPIAETMGAMEALVDAGKVRYIGVSNFEVPEMEEAQRAMSKHRIVSNQPYYNILGREIERDLLPYCQRNAIAVLAYSPLARGAVSSRPLLKGRKAIEALRRVAAEIGKTEAQVALNWCTAKEQVIAIPKSNRVERVEENCAASGWRLSAEHLAALDEASS